MKQLVITFCFSLLLFSIVSGQGNQHKKNHSKAEVYFDEALELTIAPGNGDLELIYHPKAGKSVEEIARSERFSYAINGSFFSGTRLLAKPAGWFRLNGRKLGKVSKSRQLTHVVRYDTTDARLHFIPVKRFRTNPESIFEFQTGPLVINDGVIQEELIERSPNGKGRYTRTMLAKTASGRIYFITFRHPITLTEAADALLETPVFKKSKPDIINLDGGASVSFFSKEYPQYNFNTEDTLPIIIGVR